MAGYDFLNQCIEIANGFFDIMLEFFTFLTTPLASNADNIFGAGLVSVLSTLGLDLESTSLLSLILGLGIGIFVTIHLIKFILK